MMKEFLPGEEIGLPLAGGVSLELTWVAPLKIWAATCAVSNREFRCFEPWHRSGELDGCSLDTDDQPAVNVSWDNARRFALWVHDKFGSTLPEGFRFRLPGEMEWESYARCEPMSAPIWGDRCPGSGNFAVIEQMRIGWGVPPPCREAPRNAWGLYGVDGGIWEWVDDLFDPTMNRRNLRGACWCGMGPEGFQVLYHRTPTPERGHPNFGFRIVAGM